MQTSDGERRVVNLTELSGIVRLSENTLRALFRKHPDAPIVQRGSNGVQYQIDVDDFVDWLREHNNQVDMSDEERRQQLTMWSEELFGPDQLDSGAKPMTPKERLEMANAVRAEDYVRRQRGELVERRPLLAALQRATVALRSEMMQIPVQFTRRHGLSREQRIDLEREIERRLASLAQRLSDASTYEDETIERAA